MILDQPVVSCVHSAYLYRLNDDIQLKRGNGKPITFFNVNGDIITTLAFVQKFCEKNGFVIRNFNDFTREQLCS